MCGSIYYPRILLRHIITGAMPVLGSPRRNGVVLVLGADIGEIFLRFHNACRHYVRSQDQVL